MSVEELQIANIAPRKLFGLGANFIGVFSPNTTAHTVIPQLWQNMGKLLENENCAWGSSFGVMSMLPNTEELHYFAGVEVFEGNEPQDPAIESFDFAGGMYAMFEHHGSLATIEQSTKYFYQELLPKSGRAVRNAVHLEIYDERFVPNSENSVVIIAAPVE